MTEDYSHYRSLNIRRDGAVVTVELNRPQAMNAIDEGLHTELADIFWATAADDECDAVVLTGAGRAFSAGGDLPWLRELADDPAAFERTGREARRMLTGLLECRKPIIARINGDAVGLGATLAVFCDISIATEGARIGDPHVRVGLVAGDGGAIMWPQLIGFARAKEMLMTGSLFPASDAAAMGLINRAVPEDELDAAVAEVLRPLVGRNKRAVQWTKAVINVPLKQLLASMLDLSLTLEGASNETREHRAALEQMLQRAGQDS